MSTPVVSVVIPSSRGGDYLSQAIRSVQRQSIEDWEIIVVLDGPDAESVEPALREDDRVHVLRQRRRGASVARNVGVGAAQAPLIAFLDDDDLMRPERLSCQIEAFVAHPEVGLAHSNFDVVDSAGNYVRPGGSHDCQYSDFLRIKGAVVLSSVTVPKQVFVEVGGFNPLLSMGEDLDFVWKVAREYPLHFSPAALIEYRLHANNSWANGNDDGSALKSVLEQHRVAAVAKGETEHLKELREGSSCILPTKSQFNLIEAQAALTQKRYGALAVSSARLLTRSPIRGSRVALRSVKRKAPVSNVEVNG